LGLLLRPIILAFSASSGPIPGSFTALLNELSAQMSL